MVEATRRNFITGSGILTAGIVCGASFANERGRAAYAEEGAEDTGVALGNGRPAEIHVTDVLIIGGGHAGTTAARRAMDLGQHVTVIDRGKWGHTATSGMNWGQTIVTPELAKDGGAGGLAGFMLDYNGVLDQTWAKSVMQGMIDGMPATAAEEMGMVLQRNADGTVYGLENEDAVLHLVNENRVRYACQSVSREGAEIWQWMLLLDILHAEDGSVAGVVAIDVRNGNAHVFRAKTVIMATGSYAYAMGNSISGPETTGIGHRILMDHGIEMTNMEMLVIDLESWQPYGCKHEDGTVEATINAGIMNGENWYCFYNANGEQFTAGFFDSPEYEADAGSIFTYCINKAYTELIAGRGTDNGGLYVLMDPSIANSKDLGYSQFVNIAKSRGHKKLGFEMPDYQEAVVEVYQTSGMPAYHSETLETQIPGLFCALQGASTYGSTCSLGAGYVTGDSAAKKAAAMDKLPNVSWDDVQAILDDAYGKLEAEPEDGIRSVTIYNNIRSANRKGMIYPINAEGIQGTIDELKRIQAEELPRMYCASKSRVFNRDWINALEVEAMLRCCIPTAEAALMREESRPYFVRSDFPAMDNENWLKNIIVKYENGEFTYEVRDINEVVFTKEQLAQMMPPVNLAE